MSNYILQEYCPVDPNSIHLQTLYFYSTEYKTYVQYKQYYYKVYIRFQSYSTIKSLHW